MNRPGTQETAETEKPKGFCEGLDGSVGKVVYSFRPELSVKAAQELGLRHGISGPNWGLTYRMRQAIKPDGTTKYIPETVLHLPAGMGRTDALSILEKINSTGLAEMPLDVDQYREDRKVLAVIKPGEFLTSRVGGHASSDQINPANTGFVVRREGNVETGFIPVDFPKGTTFTTAHHSLEGTLRNTVYADWEGERYVMERI